jgi:CheY-like chemotaxis protein
MSLFMALLGHADRCRRCLFIGEDRKWSAHRQTDAFDPQRTWAARSNILSMTGTMRVSITCRGNMIWVEMNETAINRPVILVVEDDFLIRIGAVEMIETAGFDVIEAANADDAIKILEVRLDITVVFTDIQMPGSMDGLKLAAAIRGRWPPIKIIATSGRVDVKGGDLPEGGRFLPKPYSSVEIVGALRELTVAEPRAQA